jgi:hypothetical protein
MDGCTLAPAWASSPAGDVRGSDCVARTPPTPRETCLCAPSRRHRPHWPTGGTPGEATDAAVATSTALAGHGVAATPSRPPSRVWAWVARLGCAPLRKTMLVIGLPRLSLRSPGLWIGAASLRRGQGRCWEGRRRRREFGRNITTSVAMEIPGRNLPGRACLQGQEPVVTNSAVALGRMDADSVPIAYGALQPGTAVQTSDGREFGTVVAVLVDAPVDVFDGINVETPEGMRFVDADQIGRIFTTYVRTTLSLDETEILPGPH